MLVITHYPDEHYSTIFNRATGFFARTEDDGYPEPKWSRHGPELLDISITNWCDRGCAACYRNSDRHGRHVDVVEYEKIMRQAAAMGVMQVALGGGNPNQHPEFAAILKLTRESYGIVPSYTTNGRGLTTDVLTASAKYCGAVAVSAYPPYQEMACALECLVEAGIKANVQFVLDANSVRTGIRWLREPPGFLLGINAIVFLSYKPVGRSGHETALLKESPRLQEFFETMSQGRLPFRIGFDSCMVSGLVSYTCVNPSFFDACEAGRFSMFVSESMQMYPCSFMEPLGGGTRVDNDNMLEVWRHGPAFVEIREKLLGARRRSCTDARICLGGCPVFPEINLCPQERGRPPEALSSEEEPLNALSTSS